VSFIDLVIFPVFLPLGFSSERIVKAGQGWRGCGHGRGINEKAIT